jgi:hypothetical protein
MWDNAWQPIRESAALLRYWRADLAREALFWHVQQTLSKNNVKNIGLGFDCRVLFQRAQCAINVESPGDKLNANLGVVAKELAKVRKEGLEEEFNALVAQKKLELQKLFATYARRYRHSDQPAYSLPAKSGGGHCAGTVSEAASGLPERSDRRYAESGFASAAVAGYGVDPAAAEGRAGI